MFPSKRTIYSGLAGIGLMFGAAGIANAASSSTSVTSSVASSVAGTDATVTTDAVPTTAATTGSGNVPASTQSAPVAGNDGQGNDGQGQDRHGNDRHGNDRHGQDRHGNHRGPGRDRAPSYTSSVTIPVPTDGSKPTQAELQAVATVTADQASAAALAGTPGTATKVELRERGGNVVYKVDVTATAGGDFDVVIDAGNAKVLDTHAEGKGGGGNGGGHRGPGRDRAPSYTSSVTIPVPTDGSKPTQAELQAVATVTADQASAAALAGTPGTATKVELRERGGNVVYKVDVTATAGGDFDVVIDAGNAKVLDTHAEHGGNKAADAAAASTATTTG